MLLDLDRLLLRRCYDLARSGRKAPTRLGLPIEPTWSALLAKGEEVVASGLQLPGDPQDAVKALPVSGDMSDHTLYLTIEPSSTYQRIAPVTESIRALGVKRVVVGAENPVQRFRGKGIAVLRQFGIEVILADGEDGRLCQMLYEDFSKSMNRSLPTLRLLLSLDVEEATARPGSGNHSLSISYDALLVHGRDALRVQLREGSWLVVIDPDLEFHSLEQLPVKNALVFQPEGQDVVRDGFYTVPRRDLFLDLAMVLRKLRDLGLLSVVSPGGKDLFRYAIGSDLVDSAISVVQSKDAAALTLSRLAQLNVRADGWEPRVKLLSPRLIETADQDLMVESEIRLQN